MGSVTVVSAARSAEIEANSIVSGAVDESGHLILEKFDGSTVDAGDVVPTKADLGLGNVNNTADLDKPISTAMQSALNAKAASSALGPLTGLVLNVKDPAYGALGDDDADDTTAIQAALNAAMVSTTLYGIRATVLIPAGTYKVSGLIVDTRVGLAGTSWASCLKFKDNAANGAVLIRNKQSNTGGAADAQGVTIRNLMLDGNRWNQGVGAWQCGIVLINDTPDGSDAEYTDGRHQVSNVFIGSFTGDGLVQSGRGDDQFTDIQAWDIQGFGFNVDTDSFLVNCDAGGCGIDGFIIQGSTQLSNCKSWYSGGRLMNGRDAGTNATAVLIDPPAFNYWDGSGISGHKFSLANGYGCGFSIRNISGSSADGNSSGVSMNGCYAQDNARNGLRISGGRVTVTGFIADSNNNCGVTNGTAGGPSLGRYAAYEIEGYSGSINMSGCLSWDRQQSISRQASALFLSPNANNCRIDIVFEGALNDGTTKSPPLAPSSGVNACSVRMNGMGGGMHTYTWASSTPITPDPFECETHKVTLGGAQTINAPKMTGTLGTGTDGIYLIPGMKLRMFINQDATGSRVVTWNSVFRLNSKTVTSTASSTTVLEFIWDGTNWQCIS